MQKNKYKKLCSPTHPNNVYQAEVDKATIEHVRYPEAGAILFEGKRGNQIHCPAPVIIPKDAKTNSYLGKIVLQVVVYDPEWNKDPEYGHC